MRDHKVKPRRNPALKAFVFFVTMLVLMLFSLLIPLRPSKSVEEKRDLAAFPAFSWNSLAGGSFFHDIDTWFADTFPLRDMFFSVKESVESLYGYRGAGVIQGTVKQGDEIPDTPFTGK